MPRSLKWLPEAIEDLDRLREFIRIHNPDAARRAAGRIRDAARVLLNNPEIGRPVPDINRPELRDWFVSFRKAGYWVRYLITDDAVIIVKIWHGRENR